MATAPKERDRRARTATAAGRGRASSGSSTMGERVPSKSVSRAVVEGSVRRAASGPSAALSPARDMRWGRRRRSARRGGGGGAGGEAGGQIGTDDDDHVGAGRT